MDETDIETLVAEHAEAKEQIRALQMRCERLQRDLDAAIADRQRFATRYVEADNKLCKLLNGAREGLDAF